MPEKLLDLYDYVLTLEENAPVGKITDFLRRQHECGTPGWENGGHFLCHSLLPSSAGELALRVRNDDLQTGAYTGTLLVEDRQMTDIHMCVYTYIYMNELAMTA